MRRKAPVHTRLRTYLTEKELSYPAFGRKIGVSGTSVYMYVSKRINPSEGTKSAIERETRGVIPAKDWPVVDRRRASV